MTAQELINDITNAAAGSLSREVVFRASFEINCSTSADDEGKQITLTFADCAIQTNHPTKINIILC